MFSLAEFASRDGIAESERAPYYQLTASFEAALRPVGALEITYAAEILRATWIAQRHAAVNEADLPDDAARARLTQSKASAAKIIRWSTAEIRRLQTDREIKTKLGLNLPGIADVRQYLKFTGAQTQPPTPPASAEAPPAQKDTKRTQSEQIADFERIIESQLDDMAEEELAGLGPDFEKITKRTQFGSALSPQKQSEDMYSGQCPCGSGQKHKRCCGEDAPAVPGDWLEHPKKAA